MRYDDHASVNGFPPPIQRSTVVGVRLFTLSDAGVMASSAVTSHGSASSDTQRECVGRG